MIPPSCGVGEDWHTNSAHDFVLFEADGKGAQLKSIYRYFPRPCRSVNDDIRAQRAQSGWPVAGRISVYKAPANCPSVAYSALGDPCGHMCHHTLGHIGQRAIFDVRLGYQCSNE